MMYVKINEPVYTSGFLFEPGVYCGVTMLSALTAEAETIWVDDDGKYWYLVPREDDPDKCMPDHTQPFDLEEFLWIKLQAKSWSKISGIEEVEFGES